MGFVGTRGVRLITGSAAGDTTAGAAYRKIARYTNSALTMVGAEEVITVLRIEP